MLATILFKGLYDMFFGVPGKGFIIETEDQLKESLSLAIDIYSNECCILDVRLENHDGSPALHRLTGVLGRKV
jgi:hypothetical protein